MNERKKKRKTLKRLFASIMVAAMVLQMALVFPSVAMAKEAIDGTTVVEYVPQDTTNGDDVDLGTDTDLDLDEIEKDEDKDIEGLGIEKALVGIMPFAYTPQDKTGAEYSLNVRVLQYADTVNPGEAIYGVDSFGLEGSFVVDLAFDESEASSSMFWLGDYVEFDLPAGIVFDITNSNVVAEGIVIGTCQMVYSPALKVRITFDKPELFTLGAPDTTVNFRIAAEHDGVTEMDTVVFFNETYDFILPGPDVDVKKTGIVNYDRDTITWEVVVGQELANQNKAFNLVDFVLKDSIDQSGMFGGIRDGTIQISYDGGSPTVEPYTNSENGYVQVLPGYEFHFKLDHTKPVTITFETKISDEVIKKIKDNKTEPTDVANAVQLLDDRNSEKGAFSAPINIDYGWLSKTGKDTQYVDRDTMGSTYNPNNQAIEWEIDVNENNLNISNPVVKEQIAAGSGFKIEKIIIDEIDASGTVVKGNQVVYDVGTSTSEADYISGTDATGFYISAQGSTPSLSTNSYKITVLSKPETSVAIIHTARWIENTATVTFEREDGIEWTIGGVRYSVRTGVPGIEKWGVYARESGIPKAKWTVRMDSKGQSYADVMIFDMFVFGNTAVNGADVEVGSRILGDDFTTTSDVEAFLTANVVANGSLVGNAARGQKVIEILNKTNCDVDVYEVKDKTSGDVIGHLVVAKPQTATTAVSFVVDAQIIDPDKFLGHHYGDSPNQMNNGAVLLSASLKTQLAYSGNLVNVANQMLTKQALSAPSVDSVGYFNAVLASLSGTAAVAYNYVDDNIVYKIEINAANLNLTVGGATNGAGNDAGIITAVDTLPEGWIFKAFDDVTDTEGYVLYDSSSTKITDLAAAGITCVITEGGADEGQILTVTYADGFDGKQTIFIKAGPDDGTLDEYFGGKNVVTENISNNVELTYEKWDKTQSAVAQSVVNNRLLDKTGSSSDGEITWKINYTPKTSSQFETAIVDTISEHISVALDSNGNLLLEEDGKKYVQVFRMSNGINNVPVLGAEVPLVVDDNIFYDNVSRELTFVFEENYYGGYSITIVTDVISIPASGRITNSIHTVSSGGVGVPVSGSADVAVNNSDVSATLSKGTSIEVTKINGISGAMLNDAVFSLLSKDGKVIYSGLTTVGGKVIVPLRRAGEYILQETEAPAGYQLPVSGEVYNVEVVRESSGLVSYINGAQGQSLSVLNYTSGSTGSISLAKTVSGNVGDTSKDFTFNILIENTPRMVTEIHYLGFNGKPNGKFIKTGMDFIDTIDLKHNQSITIVDIPDGAIYTITEDATVSAGYTVTATVDDVAVIGGTDPTGHVAGGDTIKVVFDNYKNETFGSGGGRPGTIIEPGNKEKEPEVVQPKPEEPFTPDNIPDPNSQTSPDELELVNEEGETVGEYAKVKLSDGTYVYVDGSGNPMGYADGAPMTGDTAKTALWVGLLLVALVAVFAVLRKRPTTK